MVFYSLQPFLSDVDFKNNTISINKTVNRYRKADYGFTMGIASTKSKTSVRNIPMNSVVKSTLLKLKMKNHPSQAKLPYVDDSGHMRGEISGFLFTNTIGNAHLTEDKKRQEEEVVQTIKIS